MNKKAVAGIIAAAALTTGVIVAVPDAQAPMAEIPQITKYVPPVQNLDGVQHEEVRKKIDPLYKVIDDELSTAYYEGLPFRTYGVLTKDQFDKFQEALWAVYEVKFELEVQKMPISRRYKASEYKQVRDAAGVLRDKIDMAQEKIQALKTEGYELTF